MKRLLILLVVSIVTLSLSAVPAQRKSFTHRQSDGTLLTLMLVGDENLHFYLNTTTNEKMLRGQDGDFYVASDQEFATLQKVAALRRQKANATRLADKLTTPTPTILSSSNPAPTILSGSNPAPTSLSNSTPTPASLSGSDVGASVSSRGAVRARVGGRSLMNNGLKTGSKKDLMNNGVKRGLVILVNFSDKALLHTREELDNQFNEAGYSENNHLGSVHDYFYDQSYGNFNLSFDVVGPVTLSKPLNYYGKNNSYGNDLHPAEMIIEACRLASSSNSKTNSTTNSPTTPGAKSTTTSTTNTSNSKTNSTTTETNSETTPSTTSETNSPTNTGANNEANTGANTETNTEANTGINFADYDWDGDGNVDQVFIIYAGYGEAYGADANTIWPHEWDLTSAAENNDGTGALTLDGVTINTYACSCELANAEGTTLNGIGTACHEFSHCLGFPDFYDTSYAGGFGMNCWDLMDNGSYNGPTGIGEVPAGYTSYERWCAGWLTPKELSDPATVTDMPSLGDSPEAYLIYNNKNANEYILLENRQNEKWFKYVGPSFTTPHGLLAIHVDYDATEWSNNTPNNAADHQRMSIIPASGEYGKTYTTSGLTYYTCSESQLQNHPFGGSSSFTELTSASNASSGGRWFTACSTGSTALNHELTKITNADDGTIAFLFDGGTDDGNRYTVTYNPGTGICGTTAWTQTEFNEETTLPTATSPNNDWTFAGWSEDDVPATSTHPALLTAGAKFKPEADVTLYAVYRHSETHAGSGNYELVTSALEDWAGDYLIAYSPTVFADGREGGKTGIGEAKSHVSPGENLSGNTINAEWGDNYYVTLDTIQNGYVMMTQDSLYNYQTSNGNDIKTNKKKATAAHYPLTVTFVSSSDIRIAPTLLNTTDGIPVFRYNATNEMFRYYKNCTQSPVYLYKKQVNITNTTYATSPEVSTEISVTAVGYATYYNSKQAYVMPEGLKGYVVSYDDGWKMDNAYSCGDAVPADEGLILQGDEGKYTLEYQAGNVDKLTTNMLSGTDEETALENDADYYFYALQRDKDNTTVGFYWMNADGSAFTNGGHKAYLKVKKSLFGNGAKQAGFSFDEASGIHEVSTINNDKENDSPIYNICGQRVKALQKGINITQGRKIYR